MPRCQMGLTPSLPTTHPAAFAALAQTPAPPQRRRRLSTVPLAPAAEGRRAGRKGGRTLARAVGAGRGARSSVSGARGVRGTPPVAVGAAGRRPRVRGLCMRTARDLAFARLLPVRSVWQP